MLAGTHNVHRDSNIVVQASHDLDDAIDIRRKRVRKGAFRWLGLIEAIIFEVDRDFNLGMAMTDARQVGRRIYWPDGRGPAVARTADGDLVFPYRWKFPLPDVPDLVNDDPNRKPFGESDNPAKQKLWSPGDPVKTAPMMKQQIERIASAKFGPFLVFQPVAQIQFVMGGLRAPQMRNMIGARPVMGHALGTTGMGAAGSHRMPISSLRGSDDRVMALLVDPNDGEAFFVFGKYSVDLKG